MGRRFLQFNEPCGRCGWHGVEHNDCAALSGVDGVGERLTHESDTRSGGGSKCAETAGLDERNAGAWRRKCGLCDEVQRMRNRVVVLRDADNAASGLAHHEQ